MQVKRYTCCAKVYNEGPENPGTTAQSALFECIYRKAGDLQFLSIDSTAAYLGDRQKTFPPFTTSMQGTDDPLKV